MSSNTVDIRWLVADWHFGERRLDLICRPFESTEEHDETLISRHNRKVAPDDLVLCVGDVTSREAPERLAQVGRLNGRKILIRGNHDEVHSDSELRKYFLDIVPHGEGLFFEHAGVPLFATHYPTRGQANCFNIVGHVHGACRCQLNMLNVGVDNFGYGPCQIDRVHFFINAISSHYDKDVWVAYDEINARYLASRGLKTGYFSKK